MVVDETQAPSAIAIIANSLTPYRLHLHERIVEELPQVHLSSCFTHEASNAPWQLDGPVKIRPLYFGPGERSSDQDRLFNQFKEWRKGGRILQWVQEQRIRAVVIDGYNDLGRLRVIAGCNSLGIPCFLFGDSNVLCDRPAGWRAAIKRPYVRWVLSRCAGAFYCGRLGKDYFHRYGVVAARLFPFPYEPHYERLSDVTPQDAETYRQRTAITAGKKRLLYSGRLVRAKRVDLLLRGFQAIAAERPEWDLVIAGDGPERLELQAMIQPGLQSRIHWMGFLKESKELALLYRLCDVLVLPSDYEPWGVVVAEAATGLALVCSSVVGAAADLVEPGRNGLIFPAGDAGALVWALREVTRPGESDRMKEQSPKVLANWRRDSDPVRGLLRALESVGVVAGPRGTTEGATPCGGRLA